MTNVLLYAVHLFLFPGLLFIVVMGLLLAGIDRKLVARMQNRVGASILQPWYDFLKCCGKETIIPRHARKGLFLGAPVAVWNADVAAYNARAEAEMADLGIEVNDLLTPILADTDKYISADGCHPTPEGYELLAQLTAAKIEEMLS